MRRHSSPWVTRDGGGTHARTLLPALVETVPAASRPPGASSIRSAIKPTARHQFQHEEGSAAVSIGETSQLLSDKHGRCFRRWPEGPGGTARPLADACHRFVAGDRTGCWGDSVVQTPSSLQRTRLRPVLCTPPACRGASPLTRPSRDNVPVPRAVPSGGLDVSTPSVNQPPITEENPGRRGFSRTHPPHRSTGGNGAKTPPGPPVPQGTSSGDPAARRPSLVVTQGGSPGDDRSRAAGAGV